MKHAHTLQLMFESEPVTIDILTVEHDLVYRVNFDHPVFLRKDVDEEGVEYWSEEGAGRTLRARELGEEIEKHPEFI